MNACINYKLQITKKCDIIIKLTLMKQMDQKGEIFVTCQKVNGNMIFTDYWNFLVLNFSGMGIQSVFGLKGWWKDDIYWLAKGSSFEIFSDGKNHLFSAKNVMEKRYLLGLFELFMIFQDLGNMVFLCSDFFYINISELFFGEFYVLF